MMDRPMSERLTSLIDALTTHPANRKLALDESWDSYDLWGSGMAEAFTLCDFLTLELGEGHLIPLALGYRPALGGASVDEDDWMWRGVTELYPDSGLTPEDLATYLTILNDLLDECKALGLDY